ncbi:MAG: radical SAM protein [Schwartzia sp.]|nr:radical SAM protein [Schwartzia sp. (in: firmicutes)]
MSIFQRLFGGENTPPAAAPGPAAATAVTAEDVRVIRASLLFDETWYRRQYGFGEYLDAAGHYLTTGWREGKDPSPFFSNEEYLSLYPEVRAADMNPLLHFERHGWAEGRYREQLDGRRAAIAAAYPDLRAQMDGGLLRIRITNACNAKCRYCGVRNTFGAEKDHAMEPVWYYEYCRPLYEQVAIVLVTGGDAYIAAESYNYLRFLSEKYPRLTVMTESNGIAFTEKFQLLAAKNLFKTHFSINGSSPEIFAQSCWEGPGGETVFPRMLQNIESYVERLKAADKLCFAPSLSLVINRDSAGDVLDFTRLALRLHAWYIGFFFDYSENDMDSDYFACPETSRPALRTLMEIERVLAGRVMVYFRLWVPVKEAAAMQAEVEAIPWDALAAKYADLLSLSEGRSLVGDLDRRNEWRQKQGKRVLPLDADYSPSVQLAERAGESRCFAPWGEIDLYPDGRLDFCGWFQPTLNLKDFIGNDTVDWEAALNSLAYMAARKRILNGEFRGCQACCPMNSVKNPITPVHQYGYERLSRRGEAAKHDDSQGL